jgi:four helix bundle protein
MASLYAYRFENLDVYRVALSVARWTHKVRWPNGLADLKDQGIRAADSAVLNIAEGVARGGRPGLNHFRIAQGSAGELLAVLDIAALPGSAEQQERLRRVGAMLQKMLG